MDEESPIAERWIIRGRVQGVSYRWFAREAARPLELAGSVCNLADGTVEVKVLGPRHLVDRLRHRLWQGPPMSRVDAIDAEALEPSESEILRRTGIFEIVY